MKLNTLYYILIFLIISISGNPAITLLGERAVYIFAFFSLLALFLYRPSKITRNDKLILISFLLIMLTHFLIFGVMVLAASLGYYLKICIAMLAVKSIPNFSQRYIRVIYILSMISLVFFIPTILGVNIESLFSVIRLPLSGEINHIGLYNIPLSSRSTIRNAGMFWEPGAFAGYLIIALFLLVRDGNNSNIFSKQGGVLTITLLSTQSTTGYIAFMAIVIFILYTSNFIKNKTIKWVTYVSLFALLFPVLSFIYNTSDFLGDKITNQYEAALSSTDASRITRFGNFLYDIKWIKNRPLLGWGANPATRLKFDAEAVDLVSGQGNGLTGFTVRFGIAGLLIYIGFLFQATRKLSNSTVVSIFGILIICLLLNGEQFLNFPMFYTLIFIPRKLIFPPVSSFVQMGALHTSGGRAGFRP